MAVDIIKRELPQDLIAFDDPENYEEKYEEERLLGDVLVEKPNTDEYESRCVMVFGIPAVGSDRLPKLKNVLGKLFGLTNPDYHDHYPLDADGKTNGYCFVEYPSKEIADTAVQLLDGHVLDKNHTFAAYNMIEIRNIKEPDPDWKPPTAKPYVDVGNLWWWLHETPQALRCEDQFATQEENSRTGNKQLTIWWNARGQEPYEVDVVVDGHKAKATRDNWSEQVIFKWSPEGSYLATMHQKGVVLWAGPNFEKFQRFEHNLINFLEFSPKETYLVTYARDDYYRNAHVDNTLKIFDTFTGELKKTFTPLRHGRLADWPFFKWSADEKYFGFSRHGQIHIFETEHFELLNKVSIEMDGLITFDWNPSKNLISYYCEER
uniref:RRM domain-containing protein n=1 Tax=Acrobeloides nanus TaxID=290746 RepID=A0A914D0L2_9BILA